MNKPDILGVEVLTPDGRGSILSLYPRKVEVTLNRITLGQKMIGTESHKGGLQYLYEYKDVEIIKGQYCFNEDRLEFQYGASFNYLKPKIKTLGGYQIENFEILEEPILRGETLEPHIYKGDVISVPFLKEKINLTVTWDKFGRCDNFERSDCFIDVSKIMDALRKLMQEKVT